MLKIKASAVYYIIIIAVTILLSLLIASGVPMVDDFRFNAMLPDNADCHERMRAAYARWISALDTEQFRLANQPVPWIENLLPRSVTAVILSLGVAFLIDTGRKLIKASYSSLRTYMWIAAIILLMPWYDYILAIPYMMNYPVSSAVALLTITLFLTPRHPAALKMGMLLMLCVCTGWMHEGFGLPVTIGMATWIIAEKASGGKPGKLRMLMTLAVGAGVSIVLGFSPVLSTRTAESIGKIARMPLWEMAFQLGPSMLLLTTFIVLGTVSIVRKPRQSFLWMIGSMAVSAEIIAIVFYNGARTTWPSMLFSIIGLLWLGRNMQINHKFKLCVSTLCMAGVSINLIAAIQEQISCRQDFNRVMQLYLKSQTGEVYYDIAPPHISLSLLKTSIRQFHERVPMLYISEHYAPHPPLSILPSRLARFDFNKAKMTDSIMPLYLYKNLLIIVPTDTLEAKYPADAIGLHHKLSITTQTGDIITSRYRLSTFHDASGRPFVLMMPHALTLNPALKIKSATLR